MLFSLNQNSAGTDLRAFSSQSYRDENMSIVSKLGVIFFSPPISFQKMKRSQLGREPLSKYTLYSLSILGSKVRVPPFFCQFGGDMDLPFFISIISMGVYYINGCEKKPGPQHVIYITFYDFTSLRSFPLKIQVPYDRIRLFLKMTYVLLNNLQFIVY